MIGGFVTEGGLPHHSQPCVRPRSERRCRWFCDRGRTADSGVKVGRSLLSTSRWVLTDRGRTADSGVKVGLTLFSTSRWVLTDRGRTADSGVKVGLTLFPPPGGC